GPRPGRRGRGHVAGRGGRSARRPVHLEPAARAGVSRRDHGRRTRAAPWGPPPRRGGRAGARARGGWCVAHPVVAPRRRAARSAYGAPVRDRDRFRPAAATAPPRPPALPPPRAPPAAWGAAEPPLSARAARGPAP